MTDELNNIKLNATMLAGLYRKTLVEVANTDVREIPRFAASSETSSF